MSPETCCAQIRTFFPLSDNSKAKLKHLCELIPVQCAHQRPEGWMGGVVVHHLMLTEVQGYRNQPCPCL